MNADAYRPGAIGQDRNVDSGWNPALQLRQQFLDAIDGVDHIRVALLGDDQQNRRLLIEPRSGPAIARPLIDPRDIAQPHHVSVRRADNDIAILRRLTQLVIGRERFGTFAAVEYSERA